MSSFGDLGPAERFLQQRQQSASRLRAQRLQAASAQAPDASKLGEAIELAKRLGSPTLPALENISKLRAEQLIRQVQQPSWAASFPKLAKLIENDRDGAFTTLAYDDLDNLQQTEKAAGLISTAFDRFTDNLESGLQAIDIGQATPKSAFEKLKDYNEFQRMEKWDSGFDVFARDALDVGASLGAVMTASAIGGAVGSVPGAIIAGGATGFLMGAGEINSSLIEAGYTPEEARPYALGYGALVAAVDYVSAGIGATAFSKELGKKVLPEIFKKGLSKDVRGELFRAAVKDHFIAYGVEIGTEELQQIVNIAARYHASINHPDKPFDVNVSEELWDTFVHTARGLAPWSAIGLGGRTYRDSRRAANAKQTAVMHDKFVQLENSSRMRSASPEARQDYLNQVAPSDAKTAYVRAEKFWEVVEAAEKNPETSDIREQLEKSFPGLLEQAEQAREDGTDIEVPIGQWSSMSVSALGRDLMPHTVFHQEQDTIAEVQEERGDAEKLAGEFADLSEDALKQAKEDDEYRETLNETYDLLYDRAVQAGRPATEARVIATLQRNMADSLARARGITLKEFVEQRGLPEVALIQDNLNLSEGMFAQLKQFSDGLADPDEDVSDEVNSGDMAYADIPSKEVKVVLGYKSQGDKAADTGTGGQFVGTPTQTVVRAKPIGQRQVAFNFEVTDLNGNKVGVFAVGKIESYKNSRTREKGTQLLFTNIQLEDNLQADLVQLLEQAGSLADPNVSRVALQPEGIDDTAKQLLADRFSLEAKKDPEKTPLVEQRTTGLLSPEVSSFTGRARAVDLGPMQDRLREFQMTSALFQAAAQLPDRRMKPQGWRDEINRLVARGIVKQQEVFWSGVMDYLDAQTGKVSHDDLMGFLQTETPQVYLSERDPDDQDAYSLYSIGRYGANPDSRYREFGLQLKQGLRFVGHFKNEKHNFGKTAEGVPLDENLLLHMRTTDRTLPDGRAALFVEEIQSDLQNSPFLPYMDAATRRRLAELTKRYEVLEEGHTRVKEKRVQLAQDLMGKGQDPFNNEEFLKALRDENRLREKLLRAMSKRDNFIKTDSGVKPSPIVSSALAYNVTARGKPIQNADGSPLQFDTREEAEEFSKRFLFQDKDGGFLLDKKGRVVSAQKREDIVKRAEAAGVEGKAIHATAVEQAPVTGHRNAVLRLGVKQMIVKAAEMGYDVVMFANGEQTASVYDLPNGAKFSQPCEIVQLQTGTQGHSFAVAWVGEGKSGDVYVDFDGDGNLSITGESRDTHGGWKDVANLESIFPQEIIDKMKELGPNAPSDVALELNDVVLGGRNLIKSYDTLLPQQLNKLGKEIKTVKPTTVTATDPTAPVTSDLTVQAAIHPNNLSEPTAVDELTGDETIAVLEASGTQAVNFLKDADRPYMVQLVVTRLGNVEREVNGVFEHETEWWGDLEQDHINAINQWEATTGAEFPSLTAAQKAEVLAVLPKAQPLGAAVFEDITGDLTTKITIRDIPSGEQMRLATAPPGNRPQTEQLAVEITDELRSEVRKGISFFQFGDEQARGGFSPDLNKIFLSSDADSSTMFHELAHWYLEELTDAARNGDNPAFDDIKTLCDWAKVSVGDWFSMTMAERKKLHEAFAYSFEVYLYKGEAPNAALKKVFQRISRWMKRVYTDVIGKINASYKKATGEDLPALTDEVRAVFGKMVASEAQVLAAIESQQFEVLFQTEEEHIKAGGTKDSYAKLVRLQQENEDEAIDELTRRQLKAMEAAGNAQRGYLRSLQARHDKRRREIRKEVEAKLRLEKIERVRSWLRNGEHLDEEGNLVTTYGGNTSHRLNKGKTIEMIRAAFPKKRAERLIRKLEQATVLTKTGLDPDTVSNIFGFESGQKLVEQLVDEPDLGVKVQRATDSRMRSEHPELTDPKIIKEQMAIALHNQVRRQIVATELRLLMRDERPVRLIQRAARIEAARRVREMPINQALPSRFALAARRARKEAKKFYVKGDLVNARKAKRKELFAEAMVKETAEVQAELAKAEKLFSKAFRSDKKLAKTRDMNVVDLLRVMLSLIDAGRESVDPKVLLQRVMDYAPPELVAEYTRALDRTKEILAENNLTQPQVRIVDGEAKPGTPRYKLLPVEAVQEIIEHATYLWNQSTRVREVTIEGKRMLKEAALEEAHATLDKLPSKNPLGEAGNLSQVDKMTGGIRSYFRSLDRPEHFFRQLGGVFQRMFNTFKEAAQLKRDREGQFLKEYSKRLDNLNLRYDLKKIEAPELNYTFGRGRVAKAEVIKMAMHFYSHGSETEGISNRDKLLKSYEGWTQEAVQQFLDRMQDQGILTKEDFEFIQWNYDTNASFLPEIQEAHYKAYGFYMKTIKTEAFSTRFGTFKGGYIPATPDRRLSSRILEYDQDARAAMYSSQPVRQDGFRKDRSAKVAYKLDLDLGTLPTHISQVLGFIHLHPVSRDVQLILNNPEIHSRMDTLFGVEVYNKLIDSWIKNATDQTVGAPAHGINKVIDYLGRSANASVMLFNIPVAVQNLTGFGPVMRETKKGYRIRAALRYMSNPRKAGRQAGELSKEMAERMEKQIFEARNQINELMLGKDLLSKLRRGTKTFERWGYLLLELFQHPVDVIAWWAKHDEIYDAQIRAGVDPNKAQVEARREADSLVRRTQMAGQPEDVTQFESTGPVIKALFPFKTWFIGYFNYLKRRTQSDLANDSNIDKAAALMQTYMFSFLVPSVIASLVTEVGYGNFDDDDDGIGDDLTTLFWKSQIDLIMGALPVAGDLGRQVAAQYDDEVWNNRMPSMPFIRLLERVALGLGALAEPELDDMFDLTGAVSAMIGAPLDPVLRRVGEFLDEDADSSDVIRRTLIGR